jgi:probable HAF family extracellular repeat protein
LKRLVVFLGAASCIAAGSAAAASPYTVTEFRPPNGTFSYAFDVNLAGQATGVMTDESGFAPVYRGFFYDPDAGLVDIGDLGGANTFAVALNEKGVVAGTSQTDTGAIHAFLYTPGVGMRDIGGDAFPSDISDSGAVIGRIGSNSHAFFWTAAGGFQDLGSGTARRFDTAGDFYGSRDNLPGRWTTRSGFTPLGPLPVPFTKGEAVAGNIFGQTTGRLTDGDGDAAFAWSGPGLDALLAERATGQSINNAGTIAVHGEDADGNDVAMLFDPPYDRPRGNLGGQSDFVKILDITAIDDVGHLAGAGRLADGQVHGFVMTPGFPQQAFTAESILLQGVAVDDPFRTMVERVRRALDDDVNETSCYELVRLRKALTASSRTPFSTAQRDAALKALASVASAADCKSRLPIAPTTLAYVFTRKNERVRFSVRLARPHKIKVDVGSPPGANIVAVGVPKKRVKGTVHITLLARRVLAGGATPVAAIVR